MLEPCGKTIEAGEMLWSVAAGRVLCEECFAHVTDARTRGFAVRDHAPGPVPCGTTVDLEELDGD